MSNVVATARLDEVCDILNGFAFKSSRYVDNGIRIIRIANVQKGYIEDTSPCFYPFESEDTITRYLLSEGDLLISLTGNVGRVGILESDLLPAALNQRVACLRPKPNVSLSRKYLFYKMNSYHFEEQCINASKGIAQKNLSAKWLSAYEMSLPDLATQESIVAVFDLVYGLIAHGRSIISQLDALVKSEFVEMFESVELPVSTLDELADIQGGLTKNRKREQLELQLPYLRVANVHQGELDLTEMMEIGLTEAEREKTLLRKDDLLFVEGNGSKDQIGRSAIWDGSIDPCVHQNHLIRARLNNRVVPIYAATYFTTTAGREQIVSQAVSTSGLFTLSTRKIKSLRIPVPPVDLQREFAAFVQQVDKSQFAVRQSIEQLELLKTKLEQKYYR